MLNLIIAGLPGSGKGTQSEMLKEQYPEMTHIETGQILRNEIKEGTEIGNKARQYAERGELVPDEHVNTIVSKHIQKHVKDSAGFIFDGYPRTTQQAEFLDNQLNNHKTEIHYFLYLKVSEKELIRRIQLRGREDDQDPEVVKTRLDQQKKRIYPIKDHYQEQDKVVEIDGEREIDEIFEDIVKVLD
ncbi:MAG: adenylate kinase family protein [Candidatus Cyclobacteriaceae bacterium M2_1C_046]